MVQERRNIDGTDHTFVVRPNSSLAWPQVKGFFMATCVLSLGIGAIFCLVGLWVVMLFSGLEMLALGATLYYCACCAGRREVITIRNGGVEVAKGRHRMEQQWTFQRCWTQVRLEASWHGWYASRLKLASHGREVEVGGYLNEEERRDLARRLGTAIRVPARDEP
jgi:uncharacterized membrane protein